MSNWLKKKLKAGALQLTIFIAAIIAILLAAVITLTYVHRFFIEQSKASIQVVQETKNGFKFLLENNC
jgi:cell division protein FtsL